MFATAMISQPLSASWYMYGSPLLRPWQFQVVTFKVIEGSNWAGGDGFGVAAPSQSSWEW